MANRIKGITVEIGGKRQFKQAYNRDRPVVLYHKHTADTKWYHEHWKTCTVKKAVASIKSHDGYVLEYKEAEKNGI